MRLENPGLYASPARDRVSVALFNRAQHGVLVAASWGLKAWGLEIMAMAAMDAPRTEPARIDATRVSALVLVRLCVGDGTASEAELARDLQPLVASVVEAAEWRLLVSRLVATHVREQLIVRQASRLRITETGRRQADRFVGSSIADAAAAGADDWPSVRDGLLVAKALGTPGLTARRMKGLGKVEGLGCAIVAAAHGLKLKSTPSASRLRNALALLALDRAFGNRLQRDLGTKTGLSAKAGRLLAGQLSVRPRDFGTDGRLVAGLAAEAVGATGGSVVALRTALLRGFVTGALDWPLTPSGHASANRAAPSPATSTPPRERTPSAPARIAPIGKPAPVVAAKPVLAERPGPDGFARALRELARPLAIGWSGSRKVFISQLWSAVQEHHAGWGLSEIEFKAMLTEAHRTGLLALGTSDLRDKRYLDEIQASATVFKNTVWHFVRVDE